MDLIDITAAYDHLKLAQKKLNAVLDNLGDTTENKECVSVALMSVSCAQDTILRLREAWLRRDFVDSLLRERLARAVHSGVPSMPARSCDT